MQVSLSFSSALAILERIRIALATKNVKFNWLFTCACHLNSVKTWLFNASHYVKWKKYSHSIPQMAFVQGRVSQIFKCRTRKRQVHANHGFFPAMTIYTLLLGPLWSLWNEAPLYWRHTLWCQLWKPSVIGHGSTSLIVLCNFITRLLIGHRSFPQGCSKTKYYHHGLLPVMVLFYATYNWNVRQ